MSGYATSLIFGKAFAQLPIERPAGMHPTGQPTNRTNRTKGSAVNSIESTNIGAEVWRVITPIWTPDDFAALADEAAKHHAEAVDLLIELAWMNGIQA